MRSALAYSPPRPPLAAARAAPATLFLLAPAVVAFAFASPIVIAAAGAAAVLSGLLAGAGRAVAAALRWGAALGVLVVAVNAVAAQRGETILLRGWELPLAGRIDISAEALAEGGVLALRIVVALVAFAVHSACVDPDRLLRLVRPLARRSALTATLIARLAPLAARDHARIREAALLRGPAAAPVDRPALAQRLVAGALDRAIEVAATLELRGYAAAPSGRGAAPRRRRRGSRHDRALALAGAATVAIAVGARIGGLGGFDAYPALALDAGPATLALAAAIPALAAVPFALARPRRRRGGAVLAGRGRREVARA